MVIAYTAFSTLKMESSNIKKNNKDNLDEGKLQGTKYASIYPSFWIVIYQEYNNSHIKLR